MNIYKITGGLLLGFLFLMGGKLCAQHDFTIQNYITTIQVQNNGDLHINENISAYFNIPKHGIYRSIPFQYSDLSGNSITAPLQSIKVTKQNRESYKEGNNLIIKIGSADLSVEGLQQYDINYRVRQGVRQYSGYQELYRNIMGPGREVPIVSGAFQIVFPENINLSGVKRFAYYGRYGTHESLATVHFDKNVVSGYLPFGLNPYEAVTIGIQFSDKSFDLLVPSWGLRERINRGIYLIPLLLFARCYHMRSRYGRDYPLPDVITYYPPDDITPPEYILYLKGVCTPKDIISLVYHRAVKGLLVIEEKMSDVSILKSSNAVKMVINVVKRVVGSQEKHYLLRKLEKVTSYRMKSHEQRLFEVLFKDANEVDLSNIDSLYRTLDSVSDELNSQFRYGDYYTRESDYAKRMLWWVIALLIVLYVAIGAAVASRYGNTIAIIGGTSFLLSRALNFFGSCILTVIVLLVFGTIMKAKSKRYEQMLSKLRGYKTFIEKVEASQLQTLIAQDESFIDKTLPYAIVLGLVSPFLKTADQALGASYRPERFVGSSFHAGAMSNVASVVHDIGSAGWVAPPVSQGSWSSGGGFGSGGGGFSGGGGGGGGGGSW